MNFHLSDAKALGFFFLVTRLCSNGDFKLEVPNFRPTEPNLRKKGGKPSINCSLDRITASKSEITTHSAMPVIHSASQYTEAATEALHPK